MLYTLIGNGNPNRKEVIATMDSLRESVLANTEEDFWMIFVDMNGPMSEAHSDVALWAVKRDVPFEYVSRPGVTSDGDEWLANADCVHSSKNPINFSIRLTNERAFEDEGRAVLILSNDVYEDEFAMDIVDKCSSAGIDVYDLGGQMTKLVIDEIDVEDQVEETQPHIEMHHEESHSVEFSNDDLQDLTLAELKAIVNEQGLVPRDMRSKDSLIEAILREDRLPTNEEEKTEKSSIDWSLPESKSLYFITVINEDGEASMFPVSENDALNLLG